jgi:hypothetical protein
MQQQPLAQTSRSSQGKHMELTDTVVIIPLFEEEKSKVRLSKFRPKLQQLLEKEKPQTHF